MKSISHCAVSIQDKSSSLLEKLTANNKRTNQIDLRANGATLLVHTLFAFVVGSIYANCKTQLLYARRKRFGKEHFATPHFQTTFKQSTNKAQHSSKKSTAKLEKEININVI